jgi:hypothetical protein
VVADRCWRRATRAWASRRRATRASVAEGEGDGEEEKEKEEAAGRLSFSQWEALWRVGLVRVP